MRRSARLALLTRVLWELVRYDVVDRLRGFSRIRLAGRVAIPEAGGETEPAAIGQAVDCMTSFYWKPLLCLQRSVVTARLLRAYGIQAEVVIGFRANPFQSHAWVEIGGRVFRDSPAYQTKMQVLDRF
jgi:hypothetical protein